MQRILGRAKLEGRADDADTAIIERRMKTFGEKTMPVIEKYKKEGKVSEIEGMQSVGEVYEEMKEAVMNEYKSKARSSKQIQIFE